MRGEITELLGDWSGGDESALQSLLPLVYDELQRIARSYLGVERNDHTLQATALVHESYMRLLHQRRVTWRNRKHFYSIAATMMRRILVDHARGQQFVKRGGGAKPLALTEENAPSVELSPHILEVDNALRTLSRFDPEKVRLVHLKFFVGFSLDEIAEILGCSRATVIRQWRATKAWLHYEIQHGRT